MSGTGRADRMRRRASFVTRSVMGAWPAISWASARARASIASGATISWTNPAACASWAPRSLAVKRSAVTRDGPRRSTSPAYASADRQLPRVRAMGAPKRASGVAIRRSHAAAMRRPAPTAKPWMAAMTGFRTAASRPMRRSPSRS